jgi:flagellar FliL protein
MAKEDKKATESAAPKPKKKLVFLVTGVLLALVAGGGAAWYFMKGGKHEGAEQKASVNLSAQPIFVSLDPFTVNLQREQGDQVLQVGLSLKFYNQDLGDKIKNAMPEIRSNLLLLLSSKHASELLTVEGKKKLASEIIVAVNSILGFSVPKPKPAAPPAVAAAAPVQPAAVQPANAASNGAPAQTPDSGAAPAAAGQAAGVDDAASQNRDGVVDVLFTSFIIQ